MGRKSSHNNTDPSPTTFYQEKDKTKRGILFAWFANFLVLDLTLVAGVLIIAFSATSEDENVVMDLVTVGKISGFSALAGIPTFGLILIFSVICSPMMISKAVGGSLTEVHAGKLFNVVQEMSIAAGIPHDQMPRVFVISNTGVPNAYAIESPVGRKGKGRRVYITKELLSVLNREQVQAVMAHEISHLVNKDTRAMTQIIAVSSTVTMIQSLVLYGWISSNGSNSSSSKSSEGKANPIVALLVFLMSFLVIIIAPALSDIAKGYMSRNREKQADNVGVSLCMNPTALAQALITIDSYHKKKPNTVNNSFYNTAGSLALYSPLGLNREPDGVLENIRFKIASKELSSTHPPMKERISDLVAMGAEVENFVPVTEKEEENNNTLQQNNTSLWGDNSSSQDQSGGNSFGHHDGETGPQPRFVHPWERP